MASDTEGFMVPEQALAQFYSALDTTAKSLQGGIDRLADKIDDIRSTMPTHRDVEDLKARLSKNEATVDLLREETVRRREVEQSLKNLRDEQQQTNERLEEALRKLEDMRIQSGRPPVWFWPSMIAAVVTLMSVFYRMH